MFKVGDKVKVVNAIGYSKGRFYRKGMVGTVIRVGRDKVLLVRFCNVKKYKPSEFINKKSNEWFILPKEVKLIERKEK